MTIETVENHIPTVNTETALREIVDAFAAKEPIFLWGPAGIGKTSLFAQAAAVYREKYDPEFGFFDFRHYVKELADISGLAVVDRETMTTTHTVPDDMPFIGNPHFPETGAFLVDEINLPPVENQSMLHGMFQERRINRHIVKDGWTFGATANDRGHGYNRAKIGFALANRGAHYHLAPDAMAWCKYAAANGVHPAIIAAILEHREPLLHDDSPLPDGSELKAAPTPRSWFRVSDYMNRNPDATDESMMLAAAARVGKQAAAKLVAALALLRGIGNVNRCIDDPDSAPVPDASEIGLLAALIASLARKSTRQNFDSVMRYAERIPADHRMALFAMATASNGDLMTTKAATDFQIRYHGNLA